jgi:hypothetical protein
MVRREPQGESIIMLTFRYPSQQQPHKMKTLVSSLAPLGTPWGANSVSFSFPPKSVDDILTLIRTNQVSQITILDWITLISQKTAWDEIHSDKEIATTSVLIYKSAVSDETVLSLLLFRAAIQIDDKEAASYPNSLLDHIEVLRTQMTGPWKLMLEVVLASKKGDFFQIAMAAISNSVSPNTLYDSLNLPLCTRLKNETEVVIPDVLAICSEQDLVEWLPVLMSSYKHSRSSQFEQIKGILKNKIVRSLSNHSEHLNWLDNLCNPTSNSGFWARFDTPSKEILSDLLSIADCGQIKRLATALTSAEMADALGVQDWDIRQLRSRSAFWQNYSEKMLMVRILVPSETMVLLSQFSEAINTPMRRIEVLEPCALKGKDEIFELIVIEFKDYIMVDSLRGKQSTIRCYENTRIIRTQLVEQPISMLSVLSMHLFEQHDHVLGWQISAEAWLRTILNIDPNSGTSTFIGQRKERGKYTPGIGLPSLSPEKDEERNNKLHFFRRDLLDEHRRYRSH